MSKNMLIDSAHSEEVRIAVVDNGRLDRFDFENTSKAQVKGNIYLAKVLRVEPSLQAAFVDYGGNRHGFLSFSEIHHDYFQIPIGDRQEFEEHIQNAIVARAAEIGEEELDEKEIAKLRYQFYRRYKIQEVIKKRQILLVQITKEERGNKGAAMTTYISLAGRYCVLMPNTAKNSGVSRKVVNINDRKKLKKIVSDLYIENGSVVLRTAGVGRTKSEIKKDFDYLVNLWKEIRETTVQSIAPCMIHEEAGIIKRSIRDMYSRDIESIYVEGNEGYRIAKNFVKKLMPSHAKKVKHYNDDNLSLFGKFKVNDQINQIYSTRVDLPSGGYLIINTTEALTSIDVNSGRSTRERNVAETALKTNLEAAAEIARQCRLRDLGGLLVVDFIDMEEKRNNTQVERSLKSALREDKAKVQVGTISNFGLLEFSRQRLRSSIADVHSSMCPHCNGTGFRRTTESLAVQALRKIEESCIALNAKEIRVSLSMEVALYIMNHKRTFISCIENRSGAKIIFNIDDSIVDSDFKIDKILSKTLSVDDSSNVEDAEEDESHPIKENGKQIKAQDRTVQDDKATKTDNRNSKRNDRRSRNRKRKLSTSSSEQMVQQNDEETVEKEQDNVKRSGDVKKKVKVRSNRGNKIVEAVVDGVPDVDFTSHQREAIEHLTLTMRSQEDFSTVFEAPIQKQSSKKGWWQKLLKKPEAE